MKATVNVIDVMLEGASDYEASGHGGLADDMLEARAAVAELVEAANAIAAHQDAATSSEWDRMNAALARVQGGAL